MAFSRVFGICAVMLCVMVCLCAHGTVNKIDAMREVRNLKTLTIKTLESAKQKQRTAEYIKRTVESHKEKAETAAAYAESEAKKIKENESIVANAKSAMEKCVQLYADAKEKTEKAVKQTEELVLKARTLNNNAEIQIVLDTGSSDDYSNVSENVTAVQQATKEFEKEITAAETLLNSADGALWTLSKHAENTQVVKYQVGAIVTVFEIETMLNTADADIKSIGRKKDEVNATVEDIKELFKNISQKVYLSNMGSLYNAEGDLSKVSSRVNEVKETKKEMLKWKQHADDVLVEIKEETDESQAEKQFENVKYYAKNAEKFLETIRRALDSADVEVQNAKYRKKSVLKALSKNGSKQNGKDQQVSEKPLQPVDDKTKNTEKKEEGREILNKPENRMVDANANLENKFTVKPTVINLEKLTVETTEKSKPLKSDMLIVKPKDQEQTKTLNTLNGNELRKDINNITNISLDGGKIPELGAWSDGSVIVSVPLLAALIASAVLH